MHLLLVLRTTQTMTPVETQASLQPLTYKWTTRELLLQSRRLAVAGLPAHLGRLPPQSYRHLRLIKVPIRDRLPGSGLPILRELLTEHRLHTFDSGPEPHIT
ncbi:hypothetical protein Tco_0746705 [Tanacetum coccineum]